MNIAQSVTTARAPFAASFDVEKSTIGGVATPMKEGAGFLDFLGAINPLHLIPGVASLYESLTGDKPASSPDAASATSVAQAAGTKYLPPVADAPTSIAPEPQAADDSSTPAVPEAVAAAAATAAPVVAPAAAAATQALSAARSRAGAKAAAIPAPVASPIAAPIPTATPPLGVAKPGKTTGKDIRAYLAHVVPTRPAAAAATAAAASESAAANADASAAGGQPAPPTVAETAKVSPAVAATAGGGEFASKMLRGLEKYRAINGTVPGAATVDQQG